MQYKLPQDTGSEDYFVWKITLRQLIILFSGFGLAYLIYISLANKIPNVIILIPVAIIAIITLAFAFLKKDNMSFIKILLLLIEMQINPMKRFWIPRAAAVSPFDLLINLQRGAAPQVPQQPQVNNQKHIEQLSSIAAMLDQNRVEPMKRIDELAETAGQPNRRESLLEKFAAEAAKKIQH